MISQGTDQILRCQVTEGSNRDRGRRAVPVAPLAHHRAGAHRVGLNDGARDDCDQDYVRADLLEAAIVEDVKGILRDEQFMARIWEEANRRLCAEKPSLDQEIAKVEAEIAKVRATIDRYFAAFEAQTMRPELCMQKVEALNAQVEALASEKRALEERREHLEIPAIDRDMLSGLLDEFERVIAEGTNPEKKDLLHRLVKKVLIHDRGTIEIWYALPNQTPVRTPAHPAGPTRLELATSGLTGQRSNQTELRPRFRSKNHGILGLRQALCQHGFRATRAGSGQPVATTSERAPCHGSSAPGFRPPRPPGEPSPWLRTGTGPRRVRSRRPPGCTVCARPPTGA
jgi:hypothetical protein